MLLDFGSLNVDLVMPVETLPRPGETVLCRSYHLKPGGKGFNQAVAAARDGARVVMAGCIGADDFGRSLLAVAEAEGVDTGLIRMVDAPTACASICVDPHGENAITVASGANWLADASAIPDTHLTPDTTVLLQMEVPFEQNWRLLARARAGGARTILSLAPAAPVSPSSIDGLSVLLVNELELSMLAADASLDGEGIAGQARAAAVRFGLTCVATAGSRGAVAASADGAIWIAGAMPITPIDTTGAGDAFAGVFAAAFDRGADVPTALHRASIAGALACLGLGAQESLPTTRDIDARLGDLPPPQRVG